MTSDPRFSSRENRALSSDCLESICDLQTFFQGWKEAPSIAARALAFFWVVLVVIGHIGSASDYNLPGKHLNLISRVIHSVGYQPFVYPRASPCILRPPPLRARIRMLLQLVQPCCNFLVSSLQRCWISRPLSGTSLSNHPIVHPTQACS